MPTHIEVGLHVHSIDQSLLTAGDPELKNILDLYQLIIALELCVSHGNNFLR